MKLRLAHLAICLCAAGLMAAASAPAMAQQYVVQGEAIPASADWDVLTAESEFVTAAPIADAAALGGSALQIIDAGTLAEDVLMLGTAAAGGFGGAATAVVRIKTSNAADFGADDPWTRNIILSFVQQTSPTTKTRRAVGLSIRPDSATVTNTLGTQAYGGIVAGSNTQYVTWTIVGRNYGYNFDVYRDGQLVMNNVAGASASESAIGAFYNGNSTLGADCLVLGSMTATGTAYPGTGTGAWIVDWAAVKPGEDPTWNPMVPEPGSILALSGGLVCLAGCAMRRRRARG